MSQHEHHTQQTSQQTEVKDSDVKKSKNVKQHTGKRVEYDLYVNDTIVDYVSKKRKAIAVNGGVPAPTLYFTEGDTAIIRVHNKMKEETSVHWHGLLLPNEQDGVPYLTTAPIKAGTTHTFTFPLIQSGTYWYHSHTSVQEQIGTYGSIVIYPKGYKKQNEKVILLSDWVEQRPGNVLRSLKRASDWYAIRKNSVQSWGEALVKGYIGDRFKTEWNRMPAMDVSDVYYDKFLLNGRQENFYEDVKPGEKIRLRVINGAATSYFWLQFAGGKMRVVAAGGLDIVPIEVDRMMIAIAETYDIEVTLPEDGMAYEFRATSIDIAGHSSIYIGKGMKMNAPDLPKLDYFAMMRQMNKMGSHTGMNMSGKDMNDMDMTMDHGNMKMDKDDGKNKRDGMPGMDHGRMQTDKVKDTTMNHENHQNMQMNEKKPSQNKKESDGMEGMDHDNMQTGKAKDTTTINHAGHQQMQMNENNQQKQKEQHGMESIDHSQMQMQKDDKKDKNYMDMPGMDNNKMEADTVPLKSTKEVVTEDSTVVKEVVMDHESMAPANMDNDNGEVIFNYNMLRSPQATTLDQKKLMQEVPLTLTGNMIRYVWSFDSKPLSKSDKILIKKGENVRFVLTNNTMMRHPLHLHGHFFRFVNKQGEYSPMKHTFDIQPMETVIIEFYANEEKDWFFHCHVLYHMMAGMARVVSYENSPPNEQVTTKDQMKLFHEDKMWWLWGQTKVASDAVFGNISYSNTYNVISSTYRVSYKNKYEFQPDYARFIDKRQFLSVYAGADIRNTFQIKEGDTEKDRRVAVVGARYLLPLFVLAELRVDHKGDVRFQLSRNDMPITRRLRLSVSGNTDKEYNIDFDYFVWRGISIHASYDSEYKYGAGLTFLW
jgi:FtsP/CotA-like multicopper oxidase with cupredoxin domain